jgi:hypothetical protein
VPYSLPLRRRAGVFALVLSVIVGAELYAVFVQQQGVPRSTLGRRRFLAGEVAGAVVVSQTLRMDAPGFHRIRVYAQPFSQPVSGDVIFTLKEIARDGERELYRLVRPAASVVRGGSFDVDFPAIAASEGRRYRLEVRAPNAPAGRGIGLWATNEERHAGGALFIDGKEQWGDLAFDAFAASSTAYDYVDRALRGKPWPLSARPFLGAVFVAYNVGLAALLWMFIVRRPRDGAPERGSLT